MVDVVDVVSVGEERIVSDYFTLVYILHILVQPILSWAHLHP